MSFAFHAVGSREDVLAQLKAAPVSTGPDRFNEFGAELLELLRKHFAAETATAGRGHEYRYIVKANGHGGGSSALSLQLSIEPAWVAVPDDEPVAVGAQDDDED